ncbi:MAG: threonine synthase, partial [Clostridia bacterium]|nr:threonine synthase [Clostridia bacterium]
MKFYSTRDAARTEYTAAQIIKQGLADDGGLFVPAEIPALTDAEIDALLNADYAARA